MLLEGILNTIKSHGLSSLEASAIYCLHLSPSAITCHHYNLPNVVPLQMHLRCNVKQIIRIAQIISAFSAISARL